MKTIIGEGGRLVIPVNYRKALGLRPGDEVLITLQDGEIRIVSRRQAISKVQELVRRYVPEGRSLSEELIQERRKEARND